MCVNARARGRLPVERGLEKGDARTRLRCLLCLPRALSAIRFASLACVFSMDLRGPSSRHAPIGLPLRPNHGARTNSGVRHRPYRSYSTAISPAQIAVPLIGSLVLAAMLLVLEKTLRLFQFLVDAGGPVSVVWRMLANLMPGRPLARHSDRADARDFAGVSQPRAEDRTRRAERHRDGYGRLIRVPLLPSRSLLPRSTWPIVGPSRALCALSLRGLRFDLSSARSALRSRSASSTTSASRLTLRIDRSENRARSCTASSSTSRMTRARRVSATAEHGRFLVDRRSRHDPVPADQGRLIQALSELRDAAPPSLSMLMFFRSLPVIDQFRGRAATRPTSRICTSCSGTGYGGADPTSTKSRWRPRADLNFRLVEVLMMLMLPFLAVALAVPPKRARPPRSASSSRS